MPDVPPLDRLSVLVLGAGKSGTSGLYAAIKAGMERATGGPVPGLFEPHTADEVRAGFARPLVAKMLLERLVRTDALVIAEFDRRILIVRDPRDCLVSRLLWQLAGFAGFDSRAKVEEAIDLLRRKEAAPQSISVAGLYEAIGALGGKPGWILGAENLAYLPQRFIERAETALFRVRYEDFVEQRTVALAGYLGFPPVHGALPPPPHDLTLRTGAHGQWRRWFTPEDRARFIHGREDRLRALGYEDFTFAPSSEPLPAAEGSAYALRLFRARRPELFA